MPLEFGQEGLSRFSGRILESSEGVAESVKESRSQDLLIGECEQARPQCQQVAGKVSAIHRRHIGRQQGFQRLCVVPIIKVASVPL